MSLISDSESKNETENFLVLSKSFYSLKAAEEITTCILQHSENCPRVINYI